MNKIRIKYHPADPKDEADFSGYVAYDNNIPLPFMAGNNLGWLMDKIHTTDWSYEPKIGRF